MRNYWIGMLALFRLLTRRYFRSPLAIFFSIIFPLIFLFVFGGLFGNSNNTSFKVAIINHSDTTFAKQFASELEHMKVFKVKKEVVDVDEAKLKMSRGELDSVIELPQQFGAPNQQQLPGGAAVVYYDQSNVQGGQTVASILGGVLTGVNTKLTKIEPPLTVEQRSAAQKGLTGFDYVFSGLLGFSILGLGVFGPVNQLPAEKKTGALTRLRVTPIRPSQFIVAYMLSQLVIGVLAIAVMFTVAVTLFDFHSRGNLLVFALYALLSGITIFGIGVSLGGWAKNERQAAPLANIATFPMMFLSGTFFPRFLMPEWLQGISSYLPLTPVVDGLRLILTEGKTFFDLGPQLAVMGAWIVVVYVIAFRVFRWE